MSRSQTVREIRRAAHELEPGKRKPPYHVGLRWDYENARRAGRTNPDLVEIIDADDPRHRNNNGSQPRNRAWKRAMGARGANQPTARKSSRRRPVARCTEKLSIEATGEVVRCSLTVHPGDRHVGRVYRLVDGIHRWRPFTWRYDAEVGLQMRMLDERPADAESEVAA